MVAKRSTLHKLKALNNNYKLIKQMNVFEGIEEISIRFWRKHLYIKLNIFWTEEKFQKPNSP